MVDLVITGTSYMAALLHIEPKTVTPVGYGARVTLEAPDVATREQWLNLLIETAVDLADDGHTDSVEQIYKDIERADLALLKQREKELVS